MPTTPDRPDGRPAGSGDPIEAAEADDAAFARGRPVPTPPGRAEPEPDDDFDIVRDTVAAGVRPAAPDHAEARPGPASPRAGREQDRATVTVDPRNHPTVTVDRSTHPTVTVPDQRRPADSRGRAPLPVAAAFATAWAALLSYVPVAAVIGLARALEDQGGVSGAAHAGLAGWLLGHGVPIGTSIGPLGLAPLLLTLLAGWRLNRAGLHVTRAVGARRSGSPRAAMLVAAAIGAAYGTLGLLAALVVDGRGTDVSPGRAAFHLFLAGFVCSLIGSLRGTDALVVIARRLPPPVRHALRTG
ncbi:cell division protein PerM, partial [Couchioplanes caeruleus]